MLRIIFFFILLILFSGKSIYAQDITIAAAASLQPVMEELRGAFEENFPSAKINIVLGSSGKLAAQIENGAPFDIFLSADTTYPNALCRRGFCAQPPWVYACGVLVIWSMKETALVSVPDALQNPAIKKIALANPDTAPYGREALRVLRYYGLLERLREKLVYGESISQVNNFTASLSADLGFTAKSTVMNPGSGQMGVWLEVPGDAAPLIPQAGVILKYGARRHPQIVEDFFVLLRSRRAQGIFEKYGYTVCE